MGEGAFGSCPTLAVVCGFSSESTRQVAQRVYRDRGELPDHGAFPRKASFPLAGSFPRHHLRQGQDRRQDVPLTVVVWQAVYRGREKARLPPQSSVWPPVGLLRGVRPEVVQGYDCRQNLAQGRLPPRTRPQRATKDFGERCCRRAFTHARPALR